MSERQAKKAPSVRARVRNQFAPAHDRKHPKGEPPPPAVRILGAPRAPVSDVYHAFLRAPWWLALGMIVVTYLALNAGFAGLFLAFGGVEHARHGSFADAFAFSIQTMGTIGYGVMYPTSPIANALVVAESLTGMLVTAVATGLVFAKFSRSSARVVFTHEATIAPMDGVPTLMFRVGNERANHIMEAQLRVSMVRTEHTKEGMVFYRLYDLKLSRDRSQALSRSWTVMHPIAAGSPLEGYTPERLLADEVELMATLVGTDDTSLQPVHAAKRYLHDDIVWGARHTDILREEPDGTLVLDLGKFHELTPTAPLPDFPYPAATPAT